MAQMTLDHAVNAAPIPPPDTRPIVSPQLRAENPEEWRRLYDLNQIVGTCSVCLEVPVVEDSPVNSDIPTRCTHWLCTDCWRRIARGDMRCPTCRDDLSQWLQQYLSNDELRRELENARLLDLRHEARHNALIADAVEGNRRLRATMERLMLAAQAAAAADVAHSPADGTVERALRDAWLQMMAAHLELSYQIVDINED